MVRHLFTLLTASPGDATAVPPGGAWGGFVPNRTGVAVCVAIVGFWVVARRHTRRAVGFDPAWPARAGPVRRRSDWGTARVNGHLLRGCVRLAECEHGYVVALSWVWGGGYVFLPAGATRVVEYPPRGWRRRPSRGLSADARHVIAYGRLAGFVR